MQPVRRARLLIQHAHSNTAAAAAAAGCCRLQHCTGGASLLRRPTCQWQHVYSTGAGLLLVISWAGRPQPLLCCSGIFYCSSLLLARALQIGVSASVLHRLVFRRGKCLQPASRRTAGCAVSPCAAATVIGMPAECRLRSAARRPSSRLTGRRRHGSLRAGGAVEPDRLRLGRAAAPHPQAGWARASSKFRPCPVIFPAARVGPQEQRSRSPHGCPPMPCCVLRAGEPESYTFTAETEDELQQQRTCKVRARTCRFPEPANTVGLCLIAVRWLPAASPGAAGRARSRSMRAGRPSPRQARMLPAAPLVAAPAPPAECPARRRAYVHLASSISRRPALGRGAHRPPRMPAGGGVHGGHLVGGDLQQAVQGGYLRRQPARPRVAPSPAANS